MGNRGPFILPTRGLNEVKKVTLEQWQLVA